MTLIEALKSGRRFRLGPNEPWMTGVYSFFVEQILDDQWEVEPVTVTITKESLAAAWDEAFDGPQEKAWVKICWLLRL